MLPRRQNEFKENDSMRKQFFAIAVGVLALCAIASVPAKAATWSSCSQYATYSGGGYNLYTDEWGASSGQCVYATSPTSWYAVANYSGGSGVKSYPDSEFSMGNVNISSLGTVNSSFNFSVPSGAVYDAAYDLWSNGNVDEVMVWEKWSGTGPIASSYNCGGACPYASNVSINGATWTVYQGNTGHNVVSFLRNSQRTSGTEDLAAIMKWCSSKGILKSKTFSTGDFGFEISKTNGSQTFNLYSFSK
jgi:hypothetical protein